MTEPLLIDGLTYIPVKDTRAGSHLSTEYLARLAQTNCIRACMLAGTWFIKMHSLQQSLSARDASAPSNMPTSSRTD